MFEDQLHMRTVLLAATLMTGLSTASLEAATYTYTFDGNFASSRAVANDNGSAPIPGGTLFGSITFDTTLSLFSITDYALATTQPDRNGGTLRSAVYDFDDQGISTAFGPRAVTKNSIVTAADSLGLIDYTSGGFSGFTWASSARRLDFDFDDSLLGAATLSFTVLETFGNCTQSFGPSISNPCSLIAGRQDGSFTASLVVAENPVPSVPLPAGFALLLTGVAGFGVMRRRA
jgi:hypothetical protein